MNRLATTGDRPLIVFVYTAAWNVAGAHLTEIGYRVFRMPSPYMPTAQAHAEMRNLKGELGFVQRVIT